MRTLLSSTALLVLVACVPKLEKAPDKAATAYCDRAQECELISSDEWEDCYDNSEDLFVAMWDHDRCDENGFDRGDWGTCYETLNTWDCDDLFLGLGDVGDDCSAAEICPL